MSCPKKTVKTCNSGCFDWGPAPVPSVIKQLGSGLELSSAVRGLHRYHWDMFVVLLQPLPVCIILNLQCTALLIVSTQTDKPSQRQVSSLLRLPFDSVWKGRCCNQHAGVCTCLQCRYMRSCVMPSAFSCEPYSASLRMRTLWDSSRAVWR